MSQCSKCKFYLADDSMPAGEGLCRRFPPTVMAAEEGYNSVFPPMRDGGWCGEFKPRLN